MAVVDDEVRLLTIPEVAERIGRTPKTVRNMIARGQLRAVELPSHPGARRHDRRVRITDLAEWIAALPESA